MFNTIKKIFSTPQNIFRFIFLNIIFALIYFIWNNLLKAISIFETSIFSFSEKLEIFFIDLFSVLELKNILYLIVIIVTILSLSFFFLFNYILYKESKKINLKKKKSLWGSIGAFVSLLGIGCISCGAGILFSILSFLGFSSLYLFLPLNGVEFGILGIILINISNYFLLKKLKNPFVC